MRATLRQKSSPYFTFHDFFNAKHFRWQTETIYIINGARISTANGAHEKPGDPRTEEYETDIKQKTRDTHQSFYKFTAAEDEIPFPGESIKCSRPRLSPIGGGGIGGSREYFELRCAYLFVSSPPTLKADVEFYYFPLTDNGGAVSLFGGGFCDWEISGGGGGGAATLCDDANITLPGTIYRTGPGLLKSV